MVLVDTSVWLRFLYNREPFATGLEELLLAEEVAGHEMVFGELLIGDRGGRAALLRDYALRPQTTTVAHSELVAFVRARRLHGRGVGWIDVHLLASAVVGRFRFWSADASISSLAAELGIAYDSSSR
jgi:predicted nucleic acid-binding protein